ncbi:MAG: LPS-assembly protein LptD [Rhodocyclaceae bacterium]|nr:LPS-assembly protein LptD [Rhodocyclaceae bacterium]
MNTQSFRQGWAWALCALLAEASWAALNLPPLAVDPALLGAPPAAKPVSAAGEAARSTPAQKVEGPNQPSAAAAPAPVTALPVRASEGEPRSDPGQPGPKAPSAPPVVLDAPRLPPLASAHIAAGVLPPQKTTTPFAQADKKSQPTLLSAQRVEGVQELEVVAEGDAELIRGEDRIRADRLVYRQLEDEAEASGQVVLSSPDARLSGPYLRLRLEESVGVFEQPEYWLRRRPAPVPEPALTMSGLPAITESGQVLATTGRMIERPAVLGSGAAEKIEFLGPDHYRLRHATYSTCSPGRRDWEVAVAELDLDYQNDLGKAKDAVVRFKDVPIFYAPWLSFPLANQRKSGFLAPTFGSTSKSGLDLAVPWYWNIAPHRDATITPRYLSRRGMQLSGEFRYLDYTHSGQSRVEYLPSDALAGRDRYGYSILHQHNFGHGVSAVLNLNGVSDDAYFSDLSTRIGQVTQGNLLRQALITYGGGWYGATLNLQSFQTLLGVPAPYKRLPQLTLAANRYDLPAGFSAHLAAEYVDFRHPTQVEGRRTILYPQLALPIASTAFSVVPKLGLHLTRYELARVATGNPDRIARSMPIASVDATVFFERESRFFGQSWLQTLEPRAYYLYVPYRDQNAIPIFDTGLVDFNYAQMFGENRYAGGDRLGDANQLTLAVTSRLIDAKTGAEALRASVGQLYTFTRARVTLPGETPRTGREADLLASLMGRVGPHTYADATWRYNPRDGRTERLTLMARYRPEAGKIINAGYRYARDLLGQIDVSAQWPVARGWQGVGRYNYSTKERRVIETIGGLEYNAGCWIGRIVVQRLATVANKPTSALFFQLELADFSRIGSNPLDLLRRSIPGYGVINQPTADPVFGAE